MIGDRRTLPRTAGMPCQHCSATRLTEHHYRDAGDLGPEDALRLGYCPTLAARRTATPYLPAVGMPISTTTSTTKGPTMTTEYEPDQPSQLPAGWRRYSSARLEELLSEFEEPYLTEDDYDEVVEELSGRDREAEQLTGHHHDQLDDQHNERPFP